MTPRVAVAEREHLQAQLQQARQLEWLVLLTSGVGRDFNNLRYRAREPLDALRDALTPPATATTQDSRLAAVTEPRS